MEHWMSKPANQFFSFHACPMHTVSGVASTSVTFFFTIVTVVIFCLLFTTTLVGYINVFLYIFDKVVF